MYTPKHFKMECTDDCFEVISENNFGQLVTVGEDGLSLVSHLPFLLKSEKNAPTVLQSHMARPNQQWKHFQNEEKVLVTFSGPHAYVSPSYYRTEGFHVPTWNYIAVHVYGSARILEGDQATSVVRDLSEKHEKHFSSPWVFDSSHSQAKGLLKGIVAFEIIVDRIEGKAKLNQNLAIEDQEGVIESLTSSEYQSERQISEKMSLELSKERAGSKS